MRIIGLSYFHRSYRSNPPVSLADSGNREEIDDFPTQDRSGRKSLAVYADVETAYVKPIAG